MLDSFYYTFTFIGQVHSQALSLEVATGASGGWWYFTQGDLDDAFNTD
jgi:hypothetical protein